MDDVTELHNNMKILILQFLKEGNYMESAHKLEQESGLFFDMKYFEEKVKVGDWDEVEKYLSGFTKLDDNVYSEKMFFYIKAQKYLEALDRQDKGKAVEILGDLRVPSTFESLGWWWKCDSLYWQHSVCMYPKQCPDFMTLYTDHICTPPDGAVAPTPVILPVAEPAAYTPLGAHGVPQFEIHSQSSEQPFRPAAIAASSNAAASSFVQTLSNPLLPNQVCNVKRRRTPRVPVGIREKQNSDHEPLMKCPYPAQSVDVVEKVTSNTRHQASWSLDDLPRNVAFTLCQGSCVTSMEFHPSNHTLLLVGSANAEITLWEVRLRKKLVSKPFTCCLPLQRLKFQASLTSDPMIVSRVAWSPVGDYVGVAFNKGLIVLYGYVGPNDLQRQLEIEAHAGRVNDLAFAHPYFYNEQLCVLTCGDDTLIKVWDISGRKLYTFEGHTAPVHSICPHQKEDTQFIFSTAIDGKIKAWMYDEKESKVDYDFPRGRCITMLYSADGSRLFSCGTSREGESFLVEWDDDMGIIKRTYNGFKRKSCFEQKKKKKRKSFSFGVVQFDTTQNHFLAAGDDHQIKFWDMDNQNILTHTDAEGGLPIFPCLRFNKEGSLLAVSTSNNDIKILSNAAGIRSLRTLEAPSCEALRTPTEAAAVKNGVDAMPRDVEKPSTMEDTTEIIKPWLLNEIVEPIQCRLVTLPESTDSINKVARLLYTNNGAGILALGSNGIQKVWVWRRSDQNPHGKATASAVPQHWQPNSGLLMTNDVSGANVEESVPCIALSKNDFYVISAAGGKVSLFLLNTFEVITTFMLPPPASTLLAFHPLDNNIIAIGMEDSTVNIYNIRCDEVKSKLKSHVNRISGLAFSTILNILVSSDADGQLCVWSIDTWERRRSVTLQFPPGKAAAGDTQVQFHSDQTHLLVFHETQLAIYDASTMECIRQWVPQDALSAPISYAAYSCSSMLIYATFCDGNIGVFDADTLKLKCRIGPSAYLSQVQLNGSQPIYPLVVAAHPQQPNQFAVGLSDGGVKVIESIE